MMHADLLNAWLDPALACAAAIAIALAACLLARPVTKRLAAHSVFATAVLSALQRPLLWLVPLLAVQGVLQGVPDETLDVDAVRHLVGILCIAAFTAAAIAAVHGVVDAIARLHPQDVADNLHARRVLTQTRVLSRIAAVVIAFAGVAFILMTFPRARQLGASILASAGLSALVLGLAARSVFGNLLAGLQIALSQPLRIDDVLIVQGEWGRVEEITSTYVVLKIWDERRLVVPLQWFIDNPFQNWTRTTAQIIGTVYLWVDYAIELEPLRHEATRLAQASHDFDGRVCLLQVTDAAREAVQLRLIVSSASAGQNWDLCCFMREGLIAFLRREQPRALPRTRVELREAVESDSPPPADPRGAPSEARLAGARPGAGSVRVNDDTGMATLTAPTGGKPAATEDARRTGPAATATEPRVAEDAAGR